MSDPRDEIDSRTATMESAMDMSMQDAPQLPQTVQQVMIDERPQGAMKVDVKRNLQEVLRNIKTIATAAGDDFFYSWPTKNKDGTKGVVEGPSVKCANAVSRIFGNCSVKVRAFDQGPHWIFYAQFYDMETGYVYERPFQQRKAQNIGGKMDKDRATDIVFQIGVSKAARNVVCNALSEFTDYAFDVAKEQLVDKIGRNLPKHLEKAKARLAELKVDLVRVEIARGKPADKWLAADLARVISEIQAIQDGMGHPDDVWPQQEAGAPRPSFADEPEPQRQQQAAGGTGGDKGQAATEAPKGAQGGAEGQAKVAVEPATGGTGAAPAATGGDGGTGDQTGEDAADDATVKAFDDAEGYLAKLIEDLQVTPVVDLEAYKAKGRTIINEWPNLDEEDKAVLLGRWNTANLEHQRKATRGGKKKP